MKTTHAPAPPQRGEIEVEIVANDEGGYSIRWTSPFRGKPYDIGNFPTREKADSLCAMNFWKVKNP